jgi:hypothetical protein
MEYPGAQLLDAEVVLPLEGRLPMPRMAEARGRCHASGLRSGSSPSPDSALCWSRAEGRRVPWPAQWSRGERGTNVEPAAGEAFG